MLTGDFMIIHYDKEKLISALSDFSNATSVNINLVDKDGNTQILWHNYKNYFTNPPYCRFIHSVPSLCVKIGFPILKLYHSIAVGLQYFFLMIYFLSKRWQATK